MREIAGIQQPVVAYAKKRGWLAWKMRIEGINGCPDYWFFRTGQLVIIEFKALGEPPNAQQKRRHRELREQGFEVHVIDDVEVGYALLG